MNTISKAHFEVHDVFGLPTRHLYVLSGEIIDGELKPGQIATFADRDAAFAHPVHGVEYIDGPEGRGFKCALTFRYSDAGELDILQALPFRGAMLELTETSRYPCPCCGYYTLEQRPPGTDEICPVCCWHDDRVQFDDPNMSGGANRVSPITAKRNFAEIRASDSRFKEHVRPPWESELGDR